MTGALLLLMLAQADDAKKKARKAKTSARRTSGSSTSTSNGGGGGSIGSVLLSVAASATGHLIGKGGSCIAEIRRSSGAEIDVAKRGAEPSSRMSRIVGPAPRDGETMVEVSITGRPEAIRAAECLVIAAASRTGRRRKPPAEGDAGELADIFDREADLSFQQPSEVDDNGAYPSTDSQYIASTDELQQQQQQQQQQQPQPIADSVAVDSVSRADENEGLPSGWAKGWDPQREQVYYWHASTRTSAWTLPSPAENPPRQSAPAVHASDNNMKSTGSSVGVSLAGMIGNYGSSSGGSSEEEQGS
jgi:hypothetical protein